MLGGVDAASGAALTPLDEIGAAEPLAPIVHDGCIFNVATSPPTFTRMCNGVVDQTEALHRCRPVRPAAPPRQRLDLDQRPHERHALDRRHRHRTRTDRRLGQHPRLRRRRARRQSRATRRRATPRRTRTSARSAIPEIDEDGVNEPPVARDDVARTRADQPVVVDLRRQRRGPRRRRADGRRARRCARPRWPSPSRPTRARCRSCRRRGSPATSRSRTRSATAVGRRPSANVDVEVVSNDASNRPPIAQTDIAEVRGGASAAFNVLNNDTDPDGDTFVLSDVEVPSGRVIFDPSGEINFTPEPGEPGRHDRAPVPDRRRVRRDGQRHRPRGHPSRHVEQRAASGQRLGVDRRRHAGHAQRAEERRRPRQRPADRRRAPPARVVDRQPERTRRDLAAPTTASSSSCRPSPATTCSSTRSSTAANATPPTSASASTSRPRTGRRRRSATT